MGNEFCISPTGLTPILRDRILRYMIVRDRNIKIPWDRIDTYHAFAMQPNAMQGSNPFGLQIPSFSNIYGHSSNHGLSITTGFATSATTISTTTTTASTVTAEAMRDATLLDAFPATSSHEAPSYLTRNFINRLADPIFVSPVIELSQPLPVFSHIIKN